MKVNVKDDEFNRNSLLDWLLVLAKNYEFKYHHDIVVGNELLGYFVANCDGYQFVIANISPLGFKLDGEFALVVIAPEEKLENWVILPTDRFITSDDDERIETIYHIIYEEEKNFKLRPNFWERVYADLWVTINK